MAFRTFGMTARILLSITVFLSMAVMVFAMVGEPGESRLDAAFAYSPAIPESISEKAEPVNNTQLAGRDREGSNHQLVEETHHPIDDY